MSLSPHAAYLLLEIDFLKLPLGGSSTFNTPALVSGFCLTLPASNSQVQEGSNYLLVKIEPAWEQATLHSWGSTPPTSLEFGWGLSTIKCSDSVPVTFPSAAVWAACYLVVLLILSLLSQHVCEFFEIGTEDCSVH